MTYKRIVAVFLGLVLLTVSSGVCAATPPSKAPDLIVSELEWTGGDGQVKPNTELTFSVTVKNQGTAAVTEPFTVDVNFGTEQLFRLTHQGGLAVGAEVTLTTPAWMAVSGDRMVSARVNSTKTVTEVEDWDNDTFQRNLRIGTDRYEPAYEAVRETVAESGMFDLTFNDDFNDVTAFDADAKGQEGYKWYVRRHSAFPNLKPTEYRAENGVLTMDCSIDTFAIGAATIDRVTGIGYTYTHGYLEFRLRMPVAGGKDESKTAIWSFPRVRYTEHARYDTHVEMDWLEYYGGNYYTVSLHEITDKNNQRHWYSNQNGGFHGLGDEQWHVMGYLWEEGSLRCYLDGELFYTQTWSPDDMPFPVNSVKEGDIKFDGVFSYADTQDMMLFIFGSSKIPLELDYVRIWEYGGEAPKPVTPSTTMPTTSKKPTATTKQPTTTTMPTTDGTVTTALTTVTVPTTVPSTTPTTSPNNETPVVQTVLTAAAAILGGALLLGGIAVLIVWLIFRKKSKKAA